MRIVPRHVLHEQRMADLAKVIDIIETTGERLADEGKSHHGRNTAGDARVLRMIPVCAEGVGGKIPGTNPLEAVIESEQRSRRHSVR